MDNEKKIEVTENDEVVIPTDLLKKVMPGVFRIGPGDPGYDKLREWARRQGEIKIV